MTVSVEGEAYAHVVVGESGLARMTQDGWQLVQVLEKTEPISYVAQAYLPGDHTNNWQATQERRAEQLGTVLLFLLKKTHAAIGQEHADQAVALQSLLDEAHRRISDLTRESENAAILLAKTQKNAVDDSARYTETLKIYQEAAKEAAAKLKEAHTKLSHAEDQLATIRAALGEIQMKEILSAAIAF